MKAQALYLDCMVHGGLGKITTIQGTWRLLKPKNTNTMTQTSQRIWFAVDEDGEKWFDDTKPTKGEDGYWYSNGTDEGVLFPGAIKAITGVTLTWESEPLEWVVGAVKTLKKECENKVNGNCPLHNLFCKYPECEN